VSVVISRMAVKAMGFRVRLHYHSEERYHDHVGLRVGVLYCDRVRFSRQAAHVYGSDSLTGSVLECPLL